MLEGAADRLLPSIVNEVGTPVSLAAYLQVRIGGFGRSGVGRKLGEWGMREYLEPKHIQWRT